MVLACRAQRSETTADAGFPARALALIRPGGAASAAISGQTMKTFYMIFHEGALYERPILTGGVVNRKSSATIFDYLNPGTIIERTTN